MVVVAGRVVVVDSGGRVVDVVDEVDVELGEDVVVDEPEAPPGPFVVDVVVEAEDPEPEPDPDVVGGL